MDELRDQEKTDWLRKLSLGDDDFVIVLSGPSGVGKSSIFHGLLERDPKISACVTTTTRPKRKGESNGQAYHFISDVQFDKILQRNEFLEWAFVHGYRYGATKKAVEDALKSGSVMLLDVDIQGAESWQKKLKQRCVTVFILPPSFEVLKERLKGRNTEGEDSLQTRLENAQDEIKQASGYNYAIVNDELELAISKLQSVVAAERNRVFRMSSVIRAFTDAPSL